MHVKEYVEVTNGDGDTKERPTATTTHGGCTVTKGEPVHCLKISQTVLIQRADVSGVFHPSSSAFSDSVSFFSALFLFACHRERHSDLSAGHFSKHPSNEMKRSGNGTDTDTHTRGRTPRRRTTMTGTESKMKHYRR